MNLDRAVLSFLFLCFSREGFAEVEKSPSVGLSVKCFKSNGEYVVTDQMTDEWVASTPMEVVVERELNFTGEAQDGWEPNPSYPVIDGRPVALRKRIELDVTPTVKQVLEVSIAVKDGFASTFAVLSGLWFEEVGQYRTVSGSYPLLPKASGESVSQFTEFFELPMPYQTGSRVVAHWTFCEVTRR